MLPVEDVSDYGPEGDLHLYRSLDQLQGYLRLSVKLWVCLTTLEMVRRGVGLDL